jgi:hypothetical protein
MNKQRARTALCGLALTAFITSAGHLLPAAAQMGGSAGKEAQSENTEDPLTRLNLEFRSVYKQAKERCSQETLPLIMCTGDHMILIDKDLRQEVDIIPAKYTQLKVVDHVPLALFVLLDAQCGRTLDEKTSQELDKIKKLVSDARPTLATFGLDNATLSRQYQLLDLSLSFLERVQRQKQVSRDQLVTFCRELEPMVMKNVDQAVAAELKIVDDTVSQWREKLGAERFKKLTVVIVSGHMPRERHTCFQYFSKALHVKKEGLRIVYNEGSEDEAATRDLVGMHVLDASIGETFFKEKLRMHRDLLSDGAAKYLSAHPPLRGVKD